MREPVDWSIHTEMTEPGDFGPRIGRLPAAVSSLIGSIQGLLVHTDTLALHGLDGAASAGVSRATLPVRERLARLAARAPLDLRAARAPAEREIVTCRDYALLLCSFLRTHGVEARVRCGFASYFGEGWWDHWICDYRLPDGRAWLRADAGLDGPLRDACRIAFDPADLPAGAFLTAGEAWLACRSGRLSPDSFGHGDSRGPWFMGVNVARDSLSLGGRETSAWDSWRDASADARRVSDRDLQALDAIAHQPDRQSAPSDPPWRVGRQGSDRLG